MCELFLMTGIMFGVPAALCALVGVHLGKDEERIGPVLGAVLSTVTGLTLWCLALSLLTVTSMPTGAWIKGLFALAQLSFGASAAAGLGAKFGGTRLKFGAAVGAMTGATLVASHLLWLAAALR